MPELVTADRASLADAVAHTVPVAPNAGLSAQLASSPFAPAFRHVFPLAAAPSFDVRALFGETLSAAYLAGMLTPAAREVVGGAAIGEMPGFAALAAATPFAPIAREAFAQQREPFEFAAEYVAPALPAGELAGETPEPHDAGAIQAQAAQAIEPLTTMRSALLAWNVESIVTPQASAPAMAQATAPLHARAPRRHAAARGERDDRRLAGAVRGIRRRHGRAARGLDRPRHDRCDDASR